MIATFPPTFRAPPSTFFPLSGKTRPTISHFPPLFPPLLMPHPAPGSDRARQAVDLDALVCILHRAPSVFAWQAADALNAPILDVIAALIALRDGGKAVAGRSGGWSAA